METHQLRLAQLFSTEGHGEWRAWAARERRTCADRCILGDGLLMRSDIMVWLKGF